jgi:hypothetical protein
MKISTFTHNGQDIEVMFHKGKISYVFEVKGHRYGNAVKVEGRSGLDYVQASFNLLINYLETKDAADKKA